MSDRGATEPQMISAALPAHDHVSQAIPRGLAAEVSRLAHDVAVGDAELVRRTLQGEEDAFAAVKAGRLLRLVEGKGIVSEQAFPLR